jgi:hypothetical protein
VSEYLQVWKAKVAANDVDALRDVEPKAIKEAQTLCPELLGAVLVDLGDGNWLHLLRWSAPDSVERLMAHADEFDLVHAMHALLADDELIGQGEVVTRR